MKNHKKNIYPEFHLYLNVQINIGILIHYHIGESGTFHMYRTCTLLHFSHLKHGVIHRSWYEIMYIIESSDFMNLF